MANPMEGITDQMAKENRMKVQVYPPIHFESYKAWLQSEYLSKELKMADDYCYAIDMLLFGLGKKVKYLDILTLEASKTKDHHV